MSASGVVYQASVVENLSGKTETYTGLTGRKFIKRWEEHCKDFEKPANRTKTMLSSHIWELKDRGVDHTINCIILDRAPPYNPVSINALYALRKNFILCTSQLVAPLTKEMRFTTPAGTGPRAYYLK